MNKRKKYVINLTGEQIYELELLGSLKRLKGNEFAEWMLEYYLSCNRSLIPYIEKDKQTKNHSTRGGKNE